MSSPSVDRRICFIGDSYVAGTGDSTALGWVGRLAASAVRAGVPFTTYNLGIRGQTGPQIAGRVTAEVPSRLSVAEDPRLVVSFGANDTVEIDGQSRATMIESIAALEHIRASTPAPILVVGPPWVGDGQQNRRLAALDGALRDSASRLRVPYVGLFVPTSMSPLWRRQIARSDGYHPDSAGYDLLAHVIEPPFLRWLGVSPVETPRRSKSSGGVHTR